ncbi:FtsK/SpoIIIE domain-containing protein [Microbacterium album]|uniref:Cell division protein FtsK n=1 Tax=Microbacterium album TaxID=2053191 RepID=A0A917IF38_9MICO|nr:FtsK/SpoIIIE domain-containing protein [Microbacterium album]GGH42234.1 cell division protein FtsK [Microbacterium album]
MRIKLTLRRAERPVDLVVTADATATVGDVARALHDADPLSSAPTGEALTLTVSDAGAGPAAARVLDPATTLAESGLLSGASVALSRSVSHIARGSRPAVAQLRVTSGPDAGREFALPAGATVIGRDHDADVRLSDPMVSKRHARLNVAETIEIIDLNSANGVIVGGDLVGRAPLSASDIVVLGDTSLCVVPLQQPPQSASTPQIEHVRSPRVVPHYPGVEILAPTPPRVPQRQRFPLVALLAPLVMGAVLWALMQQLVGVVMMAMSPLLLIAGFVDQGLTSRRELKAQRKVFAESMLRTQESLEKARDEERRARLAELPTCAELQEDARRLGSLLWTERPELPAFLALNLGNGTVASRNELVLPATQDTLPEYWEQLTGLQQAYASIDRVPVVVELRSVGSLGVAGPAAAAWSVARSAVFQVAARHSPAEVVLAGIVGPTARDEWEWLKWLPHTSSPHSPLDAAHLADSRGAASTLLAQIEGLIDARLDGAPAPRGPFDTRSNEDTPDPVVPSVVLVVDSATVADRARLTRVAERGPDAGVHVIWCAPRVEQLPGACRAFVLADAPAADGVVGQVRQGARTAPVALETLDAATAERLARHLAPVVDAGVPVADDSDLPRSVSYPSLAGLELLESAESVLERWRQNNSLAPRDGSPRPRRKAGNLRAVVGHAGTEPFTLDLRSDGPHALVGGTTGSGKSEFLQSWVLGMAAAHSPERVTFLFVDYKGGAAFADCVDLPHSVGLVTDLSPHLVRRALTSLRAELRHREHLLNQKGAKDLITLEKTGDPDCPPSLVIVVDEFAALVQEVPEFVDGVVDVAQRGRSLGLHLVLATQRPAGVIRENLRANTNLRIALRMADEDDSTDILGDRMAAYFDSSVPGRGAAKRGPGRITSFQTGYVGGRTTGEPPKPRIDIAELDFGGHAAWEIPQVESHEDADTGPSDIERIVSTVRRAAGDAQVDAPRRPWLESLAPIYNLRRLPNPRTDERLPLGVLDEPERQEQPTAFYEPDRDGNLAIFGTGGSGKSTALRSLVVAAAATTRNGGPTHVYGLDFSSRGLAMLDGLPHVGAVVAGDDEERVIRTIRMLRDIVDERAVRYAAVRAGSIGEYRTLANAPDEPRILLLVDGIGAFKEQYEFGPANLSPWFTAFAQIAADGRPRGVHVVVTADRPNALPTSIASTVQRRIVLRMAHEDEYLMLGVPKDVLGPASPPGRGVLDDNELQIAILGESGNVAVQARELQQLGASLERRGIVRPAPVRRLPERVGLAELPVGAPGAPVVGLDDVTLGAAVLRARGTLLVAGPPQSGRTTALATIAGALERSDPETRLVLLAARRSTLSRLRWHAVAEGPGAALVLAQELTGRIEAGEGGRYAILIDGLADFSATEAETDLDRLVRTAAREEHFVVAESETSTWAQAYLLSQPFRAGRSGILLAPGELDGDTLLGTPLGRLRRADFPPGRGFLIGGGRAVKAQLAVAEW